MNKLSEIKNGSAFFYNDLVEGVVKSAIKVGVSKDSRYLIGEIDIITQSGPDKLLSTTEVYPNAEMAKVDLKRFIRDKVTLIKNKIQDLEEELKIYEESLVKVSNDESN